MKKIISMFLILILMVSLTTSCGSKKVLDGVTYEPVGLLEDKDPNIKYELVVSNLIIGIIFIETIIVPIYVFGYDLFEPVSIKTPIKK